MSISLRVDGDEIAGDLAITVPPGTVAARRDALVDDALTGPLFELADKLGVVLAASPHAYAKQLNGHDEQGRARFELKARVEGGRLVPIRGGKLRARG